MKARNELLAELISLLEGILPKITNDSDMLWGWYETPELLRNDLAKYIAEVRNGDASCLKELELLFLPTAVLQEHSIQNGWSNEYLVLAAQFDRLHRGLRAR